MLGMGTAKCGELNFKQWQWLNSLTKVQQVVICSNLNLECLAKTVKWFWDMNVGPKLGVCGFTIQEMFKMFQQLATGNHCCRSGGPITLLCNVVSVSFAGRFEP